MKKHVLWNLALGASLTVSGAAVLHGCGSGISPVVLATGDATTDDPTEDTTPGNTAVDIDSVSPTHGAATGGFTVTINGSNFATTGTSVKIGTSDCPVSGDVTETTITCTAPAHVIGVNNVVVTLADGTTATLESGFTYDPTVSFTTSIKPLFERPLSNAAGTSVNNVACIFCHSPVVPITGDTTTGVACNTSGSTDCQGRLSFGGLTNSAAASSGTNTITTYGATSLDDATATKTLGSGSLVSFPKGSTIMKVLANHFNPSATGYQFNCDNLKTALSKNTAGENVTDPTLSRLYLKVSGASAGSKMPLNTSTVARDARNNPNPFTTDQLANLAQWYNEGADCSN